ncbi:MAG: hypothetical protein LBD67_04940 [Candidatus Accumulibacter sp.]|nr:hypothetical protein [Accumulibacter sp.]
MEKPVRAESSEPSTVPVCVDFAGTLRHPLSPFVLVLSEHVDDAYFRSC